MESNHAGSRVTPNGPPVATFGDVDITFELETRPLRPRDRSAEDHAFRTLTVGMTENPSRMLHDLVAAAVSLCQAESAGISLLEEDVFRWEAVAGVFASAQGSTMPRAESPCGICIDRNSTQLMHLPDRFFAALTAEPRVVEALLVPFHDHGRPVGTVWAVSHSSGVGFDREDERVIRILAQFASAAWQLWRAGEAAAETIRRRDDFIATLGHELRNPLAVINSAASVLERRGSTDEVVVHAAEIISRQSRLMTRFADDLLDVARIASGRLELRTKVVDLRTIVSDAIEGRRDQIAGRRQQLTLSLGPAPILIEADADRLGQVVSNLVDNASKYSREGDRITVGLTMDGDVAEITVIDNGAGVAADQLGRIFEPFVQLHPAGYAVTGGLGLGLALVRQLTERHGGTVRATSAGPEQGCCISVRLPMLVH